MTLTLGTYSKKKRQPRESTHKKILSPNQILKTFSRLVYNTLMSLSSIFTEIYSNIRHLSMLSQYSAFGTYLIEP